MNVCTSVSVSKSMRVCRSVRVCTIVRVHEREREQERDWAGSVKALQCHISQHPMKGRGVLITGRVLREGWSDQNKRR